MSLGARLFYAVACEHEERASDCTYLLTKDPYCDVRAVDYAGDTPAHLAVHGACMSFLARSGAKLDARDRQERTPLIRAVERGNVDVVGVLMRSDDWVGQCAVDDVDNQMNSALTLACKLGHASIVSLLLPHSSFLNAQRCNAGRPPPIVGAAIGKHLECIRLIATRGPRALRQRDEYDWSALHHAAYQGDFETVRLLQELTPMLLPVFGGRHDRNKRRRRKRRKRRKRKTDVRRTSASQAVLGASETKGSAIEIEDVEATAKPGNVGNGASVEIDGAAEEKSISPLHKDIAAGEGEDESSDDSEGADEKCGIPTPLELAVANGHVHIVELFMPKDQRRWGGTSVAVAIGKSGSQYGVYSSFAAALPVLSDEASFQPLDFAKGSALAGVESSRSDGSLANRKPGKKDKVDLGKRVLNFRMFRTRDQWEAATEYVQLRSYAKKRDEDHIARMERERIEAEKEAARKAEEKRLRKERRAKRREERE